METMQSVAISKWKKAIYITTGCVMAALLVFSLLVAYSRGLMHENGVYLKMLLAVTVEEYKKAQNNK